MQTVCTDFSVPRFVATKALGKVWRGAYLSSISPARYLTLPDPAHMDPHMVRVRNWVSLICGSDLHLLFVEADPRIAISALPAAKRVYLGHEVCGEVAEIGPAVTSVHAGDRVASLARIARVSEDG